MKREYRMCKRCVMDTTAEEIEFDERGYCNFCTRVEREIKPKWFPETKECWKVLENKLKSIVERIKEETKRQEYNCIIGVSGGVDSSYTLYYIVEHLGLKPLVVHIDAGWNSEIAVKNIELLIDKLNLDLYTYVVNWEEMKDLQLAFLKASVPNQDIPQDHAFFAKLYEIAVKNNIKYVITGSNYVSESILPASWGYDAMDSIHLKAIHKRFGTRPLKKFPIISPFKYYFWYPYIKKLKIIRPLNYIPYNRQKAIETLQKEFGWRYYGGKHYESRWTKFFQSYYLPVKFGYDKRKAHFSSLIMAGQMTREEALKELEKPPYDENYVRTEKAFIARKLGITVEEFENLINLPPRRHEEFPMFNKHFEYFKRIIKNLFSGRKIK